ncbi:MAG: hypothetical protein E6J90_32220 [Deltaproteobacteria bacterium]|nr:MAG: hypothetical protein E6J90_32220 [Deltaproteobacteria bacterium]TMQ18135.1 MAG: hypothetical protein E6J91_08710 [Deltaproteobacteria bacterium]
MDTNDVTTRVLVNLHGDIRAVNLRVDHLEAHIDTMDANMTTGFDLLGKRIAESETRIGTAILGLEGTLNDVQRMLRPLYERFGIRKPPDH